MGFVSSLQRCPGKRLPMEQLDEVFIDPEGLEGDAHRAPDSIRQVLLEDAEALEELDLRPGQIKENITVSGIGVNGMAPGTRLVLGEAVLEITKPCEPCARNEEIRPGLQRRLVGKRGTLARVITPGRVRVGDEVVLHQQALEAAGS
jgi:MOSC domain-containing protein YiiM